MQTVLDYVIIWPGLILMAYIVAAGALAVLGALQRRGRALSRNATWRWFSFILTLTMAHMAFLTSLVAPPPREPLFGLWVDAAFAVSALMAGVRLPSARRQSPRPTHHGALRRQACQQQLKDQVSAGHQYYR